MRRNEPPALATWLLEHLRPEARDQELSRSLATEFYSGRSEAWYWRQVLFIRTAAWMNWLRRHVVLLSLVLLWSMLVPVWTAFLDQTENNSQVLGRIWRMDWPFSSAAAFSVWLASSFIYLWAGLLLYIVVQTKLQWNLNLKTVLRSFILRVPLLLPIYFITFVVLNLLSYPGPEADRSTISPLVAVTDFRSWAIAIRIPYLLTMLWAIRKAAPGTMNVSADSVGPFSGHTGPIQGREVDPSTITRGLTLMAGVGLMSAMLVAFLFCRLPDFYTPTLLSLIFHAVAYVMIGVCAGVAGTWFYWNSPSSPFKFKSPVPLPLFSLVCATGWIWVPAMVILYDQTSRTAAIIAMIGAFFLGVGFRHATFSVLPANRAPVKSEIEGSELFAESLYYPPVEPFGYLIAIGLFAGAYLLIEKAIFAATGLLAFTSFLFAWKIAHVRDRCLQDERGPKRVALRLLCVLLPAVIATAWALLDGIDYRNHAAELAAALAAGNQGGDNVSEKRSTNSKSGVGGYESIILWPIERKKDLTVPIQPRSSPFASGSSQPLVLRFVGSYWYFQPPGKQPGPHAHEAHGSPAAMAIRSENAIALAVEAHQSLPYEIEISQCRDIEVDVDVRDSEPGEVAMAVILSDARSPKRSAMSLGRRLVISNDPGHPNFRSSSSVKSLRFPIPEHHSLRQFNEITVELISDIEHSLIAPRVAIEQFRIFPM